MSVEGWFMQRWKFAVVGALVFAAGCQQSPYELAPVRGKVTIEGQPFNQGKVMFAPSATDGNPNPGKPAFALLQSDGSFVLGTYEDGDGAVVGEHTVTIIRPSANGDSATLPTFSRLTLPRKMAVVSGQKNEINIDLTMQDVARLGQLD